jgi:Ca2+-binding RTX toxin-like protein
MAIKINVSDANADGKGINFATYLKQFAKTYDATGYGDFSGETTGEVTDAENPLGAKAYVSSENEAMDGRSVIFNASDRFIYDFYNGHVISGKLKSIVIGTDTEGKSIGNDNTEYTNSADVTISGFKPFTTSSADGDLMGDMMHAKTSGIDDLYKLIQSDSIVFKGSTGNDVFKGYDRNDKIYGGAGNDKLDGAKGNDYIDGDAGNDKLTGGLGADTFFFAAGDGKDKITDFEAGKAGKDKIEFASGLFDDFNDVLANAVDTSAGVKISYEGGTLTLVDVAIADLHKGDFHLL